MIQIKYVGKSDVFGLENGTVLQVVEGTTIGDVLATVNVQKAFHKLVVPQVNGKHQSITYVLQANDELDFFLPIGGG
jgi:sulfur carrier protein ThiS